MRKKQKRNWRRLEKVVDILPLMAEGKTNQQIADLYGVKRVTVGAWVTKLKKAGYELPYRPTGARRTPIC